MDGGLSEPDWKEIGLELRRHGWGMSRVAKHLNAPKTTVQRWFEGSTPSYPYGAALIRLHNRVVTFRAVNVSPRWQTVNSL